MSTQYFLRAFSNAGRFGLGPRLAIIVLVLISESVGHTFIFQSVDYAGGGDARGLVQVGLHSLFRFVMAYIVFVTILSGSAKQARHFDTMSFADAPLSRNWGLIHVALAGLLVSLSFKMHSNVTALDYWLLASMWLICGVGAVGALFMALASAQCWMTALRSFRLVLLSAILPALAAVFAVYFSQLLWTPTAKITFSLVDSELNLFIPGLYSDADSRILGTDRFRVLITDVCSGMEGLGLTFIFCAVILWVYRRHFRFPRAFIILPTALSLMFLLNSFRIAALVLIGNAGYPEVASVGFHSQAGWILFNLVALSVAMVARRSAWLSVSASHLIPGGSSRNSENPVAPYLVPLVVSLAVGMLAMSLSAGFDLFYPSRLIGAGAALWIYRRRLRQLDWRFSWRAPCVGTLVFLIWIMFDRIINPRQDMPGALALLPESARSLWIVCRAAGAAAIVPIVEELAFRGYVLRIFTSKDFDSIRFRDVRWPSLAASSVLFGVIHGSMWLPGILAGLAYGWLAIRSDRLGEAVAAHATTNALLVVGVLVFNNWQLW